MIDNNIEDNGMTAEEAKASVLEFINQMASLKASADQHKQVLKTIEELGVPMTTMDVEFDGQNKKCIVIPITDLFVREYEMMTGYNASTYLNGALKRAAERYDYIQNPEA